MNLYEIAFSSHLYDSFTDFGKSYDAFRDSVENRLNLTRSDHRDALLLWLNQWGCRQFALEHHNLAKDEILAWYQADAELLPKDNCLWELSEDDLKNIEFSYDSLASKIASYKKRNNSTLSITIGPTGASKIFFALRPGIYVPWDGAMRNGLGFSGCGSSYVGYLKRIIKEIESLSNSCLKNNVKLLNVPTLFGRPKATIPQLVGEYFWITETKKCIPPPIGTIKRWVKWG